MEKKGKQNGGQLLPVLLCCMLLACAGLVFAIYTHRELCWLKTQIREQQKIIQTLQLGANNARDIQGSETVRIRRSAQDSCTCVGKPGRQGTRGPVGPPGSRGPRGLPGSVRHESIHLVGNGQKIRSSIPERVKSWELKHKEGSILYHPSTGFIEVKRSGYYFIYSQMYYYDGSVILMGHYTYINYEKVMESRGSIVSARRKYNTKYHGGVFLLHKNDIISVRIPFNMQCSMDREGSFFGAFLLGDLGTQDERVTPPPTSPASVGESISLAGDDTPVRNPISHIITNWIVRDKLGAIKYDRGVIRIMRAGHYFIYNQMYYYDARTHVMVHHTYINNDKVMESVGSAITDNTKYNTKYHGGVFLLQVNDTISVRIPHTRHYNMKSDASFFGAFLLYPGESR